MPEKKFSIEVGLGVGELMVAVAFIGIGLFALSVGVDKVIGVSFAGSGVVLGGFGISHIVKAIRLWTGE